MRASVPEASTQSTRPFYVNDWLVCPASGEVCRWDSVTRLPPQAIDVLVHLAAKQDEVVSREELEAAIWDGRVVGYDALTGVIFKLRRAFEDDSREPRIIETIPKRGYRLLGAVRPADQQQTDEKAIILETRAGKNWGRSMRALVASALVVIAVLAFAGFLQMPTQWQKKLGAGRDQRHVIAVLPFRNLGTSNSKRYFAEGLTDELIASLARFSDLVVISRDSAFIYKDDHFELGEIAESLGAGYLLHGSVRKDNQQLRISAKLVNPASGRLVWADSFNGPSKNVFSFQDEIVQKVSLALALKAGSRKGQDLGLARTENIAAYEQFLVGRQHFYRFVSKDENLKARARFKAALEQDPDFAIALAMLSWTHAFDAMNGWSSDRVQSLHQARDIARQALAIQEELPQAHFVLGLSHRETGRYAEGLVEANKAIALDPNFANGHVLLATLLYYTGRLEEGVEHIKLAMQLNPHHPFNYAFHLGQAHYVLGHYNEAIDALKKGIASNPAFERLHVWLAAAYAQSGQLDEALWEAEQILVVNPTFSINALDEPFSFRNSAERQDFLMGLQMAGLPN